MEILVRIIEAVDDNLNDCSDIVAVDSVTPTMFVISEQGELLRWFDCADYMREPSDIAVGGREFYVCDFKVSLVTNFVVMGG